MRFAPSFYILLGPFEPGCFKRLTGWVEGNPEPVGWEDLSRKMYDYAGEGLSAYVLDQHGLKRWEAFSDLAVGLDIDDPKLSRQIEEELSKAPKRGRLSLQELLKRLKGKIPEAIAIEAFEPQKPGLKLQFRVRFSLIRPKPQAVEIPAQRKLYAVG